MRTDRRRTLKFYLALLALFALAAAFCFFAHDENRAPMEIGVLTEAEYARVLSKQRESSDRLSAGVLQISGETAPYDRLNNTYYVPEPPSGKRTAELSWSNRAFTAAFLPDALLNNLPAAIADGHAFTLLVSDGKRYHYEHVVFTGLPAITLKTESEKSYAFGDGVPAGTLTSFEPGENGYKIVRSLATFKPRGNTTARFDKTPLRIGLYHANKAKNYVSLVGMREDDDWILNSLYTDSSKLRDKLSTDLWNAVADTNPAHDITGTRMQYVELFYDDEYMGLYGLMEPIGKKSTNLNQRADILYQGKSFLLRPEDFEYARGSLKSFAVEIAYPKKWTGEALWDPILTFIDCFKWNPDNHDTDEMRSIIDLENAIDHTLFMQAATCTDNFFHNNFYLARFDEAGHYAFLKIPWDMNYSFGDRWEETPLFTVFDEELVYSDNSMPDVTCLLRRDPVGMGRLLSARWFALRETVFSDANMRASIESASKAVTESGALSRDAARWPDAENEDESERIWAFTEKRLAYLDEYYASLSAGGEAER